MTLHIYLWIIVIFVVGVRDHLGALVGNCPQTDIKFEKLIGIRPNSFENKLLYRGGNKVPITLECLTKCSTDDTCLSFLLYYNTSECYSYSNSNMTVLNYDYDSRADTNVVWFRKTCLKVSQSCNTKGWAIEIVAGATLIGYNERRINGRITRQLCIENCVQETNFICKSIKFSVSSQPENTIEPDPIGICVLSDTDRHLSASGFRVSRYEDEYIENQCVNNTQSKDYCAYEEYDNTTLEHTDLLFQNLSQQQCQQMCEATMAFNCRGYSIVPERTNRNSNAQTYTCLLHSEDSKLIGPKLLVNTRGAKYFEKARCLNVSVTCTSDEMTVKYQPEQPFSGRIYTSGYSNTKACYADGKTNRTVTLQIPLNGSLCGVTEAHTTEPLNRTLKSALLVIQYNALIQTQADRLIKVGCVYGDNDEDPEITLGTTVNFTNTYPNRGSTIVNSSSVLPTVTMRVVDYNTKKATRDTEIGQELQMIIEIRPGDGPYDIWAGRLIATSNNGLDSLILLDDNGCPTFLNVFPAFTKVQTNSSKMLVANFQAFKFMTTPIVRFSVMVHFCTLTCPTPTCITEDGGNRRRRETESHAKEQLADEEIFNATVYKINSKKNSNDTDIDIIEEMLLNILLIVRGVNLTPDQLVMGESNRILVAGYDYVTNEVCVNYSLFVGLLVMWVLLQVIIVVCCYLLIRKYKKYFYVAYTRQMDDMHQNFGFGGSTLSRRVHWADQ